MKGFISYRFTGETEENLRALLAPVREKLIEGGVDTYCNFFDEDLPLRSKNFKPQDYVFDALKTLEGKDVLFVIITSENKSEGMILEVGYSLAKGIPVVVAVKDGVGNTYLPGMAKLIINWSDIPDLLDKISKTDFKSLMYK